MKIRSVLAAAALAASMAPFQAYADPLGFTATWDHEGDRTHFLFRWRVNDGDWTQKRATEKRYDFEQTMKHNDTLKASVRACNENQCSAWSAEASYKHQLVRPSNPSNLVLIRR